LEVGVVIESSHLISVAQNETLCYNDFVALHTALTEKIESFQYICGFDHAFRGYTQEMAQATEPYKAGYEDGTAYRAEVLSVENVQKNPQLFYRILDQLRIELERYNPQS
jgi:hypothetical protein